MNETTLQFHNDKIDLERTICEMLNAFQQKTGLRLNDVSFFSAEQLGIDPPKVVGVDLEFTL